MENDQFRTAKDDLAAAVKRAQDDYRRAHLRHLEVVNELKNLKRVEFAAWERRFETMKRAAALCQQFRQLYGNERLA
jgi:hypothetical protein